MKRNVFYLIILTVFVSSLTTLSVSSCKSGNNSVYKYPSENMPVRLASYSSEEFPDFTYAAEHAVKAVVHVQVVKKGRNQSRQPSIFDFFFGYGQPQQPRDQIGAGSGVIITTDGYIVTNNHVIDGADDIEVTLENKQIMKAKLVGADPATDIALLKIDAENLPFIAFGDSDALRLGEWVLAIGNPYNLRSTVTAGIVSARGRSMPSYEGEFKIEAFIQTDAAVNSGNSGGALINTRGELIGINTAIASRTGDFAGYSFAIPTTIVKKAVEDLMDFGVVQRALIGISMQEIDGNLAKEKGLSGTKGVYIAEVVRGGAAEKAGVKTGDILLSINGVDVNSSPAVQEQVSRFRPKEIVNVKVIRGNRELDIPVTLDSRESVVAIAEREGAIRLFGAEIVNASKDKLESLKVDAGVEVVSVSEGKFRDIGIKEGFVITHVNQYPIETTQNLLRMIQRSSRSVLIEGIYPNGETAYYGMGI